MNHREQKLEMYIFKNIIRVSFMTRRFLQTVRKNIHGTFLCVLIYFPNVQLVVCTKWLNKPYMAFPFTLDIFKAM